MKRLFSLLLCTLFFSIIYCKADNGFVLQVNLKDGRVVEYYIADISKVSFDSKQVTVKLDKEEYTIPSSDVKNYSFKTVYVLNDMDVYSETSTSQKPELHYVRDFANTCWQALYVPFSMSYDDWKDDFEVAKINKIKASDTDNDGVVDDVEFELAKIQDGSINANTPYLIRAWSKGRKVITLDNATIYPAEENKIALSDMNIMFTFRGTYTGITGYDMYLFKYYVADEGSLHCPDHTQMPLSPMRWYMYATDESGARFAMNTKIRIADADGTGIDNVSINGKNDATYSIDGRIVDSDYLKAGIYIKGGKKIIVR